METTQNIEEPLYVYDKFGIVFKAYESGKASLEVKRAAFGRKKKDVDASEVLFCYENLSSDISSSMLEGALIELGNIINQNTSKSKIPVMESEILLENAYDFVRSVMVDIFQDLTTTGGNENLKAAFCIPKQLYNYAITDMLELCGKRLKSHALAIWGELEPKSHTQWALENQNEYVKLAKLFANISNLADNVNWFYENGNGYYDDFDDEEDENYSGSSQKLKQTEKNKAESQKKVAEENAEESQPEELKLSIKDMIDQRFSGLVGLEPIKRQLHKIVAYTVQNRNYTDLSLHMAFVGNPGTGKTTVAKIVADILCEAGLLESRDVIVKSGAELQGKYLGETPHLVNKLMDDGIGKVVLIDEAYNLAENGSDGGADYKKEAISTLIARMEQHRKEMCIIFAGYTKEMEDFLDMNPGLRSRVPHKIEFKDFSHEEVNTIFDNLVAMSEKTINEDALEQIHLDLGKLSKRKDFANARGVRNVFQSILYEQAMRIDTTDQNPNIILEDVQNGVVAFSENFRKEPVHTPIGFGSNRERE